MNEQCIWFVCFIPLDPGGQKFFGFSEFLAALALMVLAWTTADIRYRFRVRTAPLPLQNLTFIVIGTIGILTLLTDLWRVEGWLVPAGRLLTPGTWQALLGATFLLTFLTWAWFAFVYPPKYNRFNAERFALTLYRIVLKGDSAEIAIIADELAHSAPPLIKHAPSKADREMFRSSFGTAPPEVVACANDVLLLLADKRLCRAIVDSSPHTALAVFHAMADSKKYDVQVGIFARNVVQEAIENKNSFLYHEAEGYDSGLIGFNKPLSQAMFSDHQMVHAVDMMLDPDYAVSSKWQAEQWEGYCRAVLMVVRSYASKKDTSHSYVLHRAFGNIKAIAGDAYKLNEIPTAARDIDVVRRLQLAVAFCNDVVKIFEEVGVPKSIQLRVRNHNRQHESIYDHVATMMFDIVFDASAVISPRWECWTVQHNTVWGRFHFAAKSPAWKVVLFKLHRQLYDEITEMNTFPNFKGARILGLCLNVMGLQVGTGSYGREYRALHKAVLGWTKQNFTKLYAANPNVANACLVDGMSYDEQNLRLVRTSPAEGLRREAHYAYLFLDPV